MPREVLPPSGTEEIGVPPSTRFLLFGLGALMTVVGVPFVVLPLLAGSRPAAGDLGLSASFIVGGSATMALAWWLGRPWVTLTADALILHRRGTWKGLGRTDLILRREEIVGVVRKAGRAGAQGFYATTAGYALALASGRHIDLGQDYAAQNLLGQSATPPFWGPAADRITHWLGAPAGAESVAAQVPPRGYGTPAQTGAAPDQQAFRREVRHALAFARVRTVLLIGFAALAVITTVLEFLPP